MVQQAKLSSIKSFNIFDKFFLSWEIKSFYDTLIKEICLFDILYILYIVYTISCKYIHICPPSGWAYINQLFRYNKDRFYLFCPPSPFVPPVFWSGRIIITNFSLTPSHLPYLCNTCSTIPKLQVFQMYRCVASSPSLTLSLINVIPSGCYVIVCYSYIK